MICPYNRKKETQYLQWDQSEEDEKTTCVQVSSTTIVMMDCPREGCGAWRDGHCCYAAVSLE